MTGVLERQQAQKTTQLRLRAPDGAPFAWKAASLCDLQTLLENPQQGAPQSCNGLFVANNPVNAVDPYGLDWSLTIRASEDHAWVVVRDYSTGRAFTFGRWESGYGNGPNKGSAGVRMNSEIGRKSDAERTVIFKESPIIVLDNGYNGMNNNCTTYAYDMWLRNTGEAMSINNGLYNDPNSLVASINNMNKAGKPKPLRAPAITQDKAWAAGLRRFWRGLGNGVYTVVAKPFTNAK